MLCYSAPPTADYEWSTDSHSTPKAKTSNYSNATYNPANSRHSQVILTQPDGRALRQTYAGKPRNYIGLAVVVMVCFNPPLGLLATILSVKSNKDFEAGNFDTSRLKGKVSLTFSVLGILMSASIVLLVIFWPVFFRKQKWPAHYVYQLHLLTFRIDYTCILHGSARRISVKWERLWFNFHCIQKSISTTDYYNNNNNHSGRLNWNTLFSDSALRKRLRGWYKAWNCVREDDMAIRSWDTHCYVKNGEVGVRVLAWQLRAHAQNSNR